MNRLQQASKTTLMVTHDLPTAFATSQRFSLIHVQRGWPLKGLKRSCGTVRCPMCRSFCSRPMRRCLCEELTMERSNQIGWAQVRAGVFILINLLLVAGAILLMGQKTKLFVATSTIKITMKNVMGLKEGAGLAGRG